MKITVRLYGTLRRYSNRKTPGIWIGAVRPGATIRDLIEQLGASEREVAVASINHQPQHLEILIPEGAEVVLVPYVGGG